MNYPSISVITVTYNAGALLRKTIDSVLEQAYPNMEYIIIDGASTDNSLALISSYGSRIDSVLSEKDEGIYDAMNKGLKLATGEYVIFMNSGDSFYAPDTLNTIFSLPPADIYYGQTRLIHTDGSDAGERWLMAPESITWKDFKKGMLISHQAFIVKRDLAPFYDLRFPLSADVDWCIRCMQKAHSLRYTGGYVCWYLVGGASKQQHLRSLLERFSVMQQHYGFFPTLLQHLYFVLRLPFRR